jgi:hypothetical protein
MFLITCVCLLYLASDRPRTFHKTISKCTHPPSFLSCCVHVMLVHDMTMSCSCHHFTPRRSEKIISQFTRPAKYLVSTAELGLKAFSYVKRESRFFLHFGAQLPYPINRVHLSFYIPFLSFLSLVCHLFICDFTRLSFIQLQFYPSVICDFTIMSSAILQWFYARFVCSFYSCRPLIV